MAYVLGATALLLALLAVVVPGLYTYAAGYAATNLPALRNKRICLLIAHPDDEAMFFAPTILALTRPETGNHVKILCLSTGDADGLGETRKKELIKSGMSLGLQDEDDVFVVDRPQDFPDSMTTNWDQDKISNLLCSAFAPHLARQQADNDDNNDGDGQKGPTANIDVLITFDETGISSHPNHISLYHGARAFIAALLHGKDGWSSPVDLYTLPTVNMLRKYSSIGDMFATLGPWVMGSGKSRGTTGADGGAGEQQHQHQQAHPQGLVFLSALTGQGATLGAAWHAMTQAHKSQMVWFRYLWIGFSRYMVINDLQLEEVKKEA